MTTENLQSFFVAKITLKNIYDYSTPTYYLSSREPFDDQQHVYLPVLRSVSGLGQTVGMDLPQLTTGTLTIDDSWGAFAYEAKFSDLLERHTVVDQPVEVYRSFVELDNLSLGDNLTLIFRGRMKQWSATLETNPTVSIPIESVYIEDRQVTKLVEKDAFYAAPEASIGKTIPVIFGQRVEVDPIRVSPDYVADTFEVSYAEYVYGVTFGTQHLNGGVEWILSKGYDDKYREVHIPASVDTPVFSSVGTPTVAWDFYDRDASHTGKQDDIGIPLAYIDGSTNYVIVGGQVTVKGNYGGAWDTDSEFTIQIYERGPKWKHNPRREPVASVDIDKSQYLTQFRTVNYFDIEFRFKEPVFLTWPHGYILNFTQGLNDAETDYVELGCVNAPTIYYRRGYYTGTTKRPNRWQPRFTGGPANLTPLWKLYGMRWSASVGPLPEDINSDGLGHQTIGLTQHVFTDTTQPVCDLTKLDIITVVNGLRDDSVSGTVTGTTDQLLERPYWILKLLTKTWNGSTWEFNTTDYEPYAFVDSVDSSLTEVSPWFVKLAGRTDSATSLQNLMQEILQNSMGRLVTRNNGKMAFNFYGIRTAPTFEFTDDNCLVLSMQELGTQTVVNRVQAYFDRSLSTVTARSLSAESSFKNYRSAIDYGYDSDSFSAISSTDSFNVFGNRTLNKKRMGFDWTRPEYGSVVARHVMTLYPFPHKIITVRAVFQEFATLELLDTGTIQSVRLPAHFGTDADARKPVYNGLEVDIKRGGEYRRAQRYSVQVVQRDYDFSDREAPGIIFTLRILRPDLGDMS